MRIKSSLCETKLKNILKILKLQPGCSKTKKTLQAERNIKLRLSMQDLQTFTLNVI